MKRAVVYYRDPVLLVYPNLQTNDGFYLATSPYVKVERKPQAVGNALRDALAVDRRVATPKRDEYTSLSQERYSAAGVKNEAAFIRKAILLDVIQDADGFRLIPNRNGGATGASKGFSPAPEEALRLPYEIGFDQIGVEILKIILNEN